MAYRYGKHCLIRICLEKTGQMAIGPLTKPCSRTCLRWHDSLGVDMQLPLEPVYRGLGSQNIEGIDHSRLASCLFCSFHRGRRMSSVALMKASKKILACSLNNFTLLQRMRSMFSDLLPHLATFKRAKVLTVLSAEADNGPCLVVQHVGICTQRNIVFSWL